MAWLANRKGLPTRDTFTQLGSPRRGGVYLRPGLKGWRPRKAGFRKAQQAPPLRDILLVGVATNSINQNHLRSNSIIQLFIRIGSPSLYKLYPDRSPPTLTYSQSQQSSNQMASNRKG